MKLNELINPDLLHEHLINGFVSQRKHPELPLYIYNYTHRAQHEPKWGDGTIDWCRGLIADSTNEIIALPFKKFHNINTTGIPETFKDNLPNETPIVTEKMDGSLGIYWEYDGKRGVATRGSFTSDQAIWATNWLNNTGLDMKTRFEPTTTPLFEIIYPENRIVVDYDFQGLSLIGLTDKTTAKELPWIEVEKRGIEPFVLPSQFQGYDLEDLATFPFKNFEGFVLTYSNGLKIKIKLEEYMRLHKLITGMNPRHVWECLKNDTMLPKDGTPQFQEWVSTWSKRIMTNYRELADEARKSYLNRPPYDNERDSRKTFAWYVQGQPRHLHSILFNMYDGKDPSDIIWKMIEPKGNETFKSEFEGVGS